jgi:hypothetical protein
MFNPKTGRGDFSFIDSFAHWLFKGKRGRFLFLILIIGIAVYFLFGNSNRNVSQVRSSGVPVEAIEKLLEKK